MIRVNVKLFATLTRNFPDYDPRKGIDVEMKEGASFEDLLHALNLSKNEARSIYVNGIPKTMTDPISDRDEVKIFTLIVGG